MEKNIVIKEIDRYYSKKHKGNVIPLYLIYLQLEDGTKLSAYSELGDEAKQNRVNELLVSHFNKTDQTDTYNKIIIEETIF